MNASDLTDKWVAKTLTRKEIRLYLLDNLRASFYHNDDTVNHVADLCHWIYRWHTDQINHLGSFLCSVAKGDLVDAVHLADEINRTALWLYVGFIYNVTPGGFQSLRSKLVGV